jgi:K+/H+ antiporter YhaU regulatory subunit KhtT
MERAAVDGFVSGEGILARLLSQEFCTPGIHDIFGQLISNEVGSEIYIHETNLVDFPIGALRKAVLEHDSNLQVIGIIHKGEHILNPDKSITIAEGDRLVVLSENHGDLGKLEKIILENQTAASAG